MSFDDENNSRIDMTMIIDDDDGHGVEIFWWDGLVKFGIWKSKIKVLGRNLTTIAGMLQPL